MDEVSAKTRFMHMKYMSVIWCAPVTGGRGSRRHKNNNGVTFDFPHKTSSSVSNTGHIESHNESIQDLPKSCYQNNYHYNNNNQSSQAPPPPREPTTRDNLFFSWVSLSYISSHAREQVQGCSYLSQNSRKLTIWVLKSIPWFCWFCFWLCPCTKQEQQSLVGIMWVGWRGERKKLVGVICSLEVGWLTLHILSMTLQAAPS